MNSSEDGDQPLGEWGDVDILSAVSWPDEPAPTVGEAYLEVSCNFRGIDPRIREKLGLLPEPAPRPRRDWSAVAVWLTIASVGVLWLTGLIWFVSGIARSWGW